MSYIEKNKEAWEEAFENRDPSWGIDIVQRIKTEKFPFLEKEWIENGGMYYITKKRYESKTFINYTHSLSEIMSGICSNGMVITEFKEFDYDISGMFSSLDHKAFPLSYVLKAEKVL